MTPHKVKNEPNIEQQKLIHNRNEQPSIHRQTMSVSPEKPNKFEKYNPIFKTETKKHTQNSLNSKGKHLQLQICNQYMRHNSQMQNYKKGVG